MPRLHSDDIFAAMHYNRTVTVSSLRDINNIRAHVHTLLNKLRDTVFEIGKMESSEHYTTIYLSKPKNTLFTGYNPFGTISISPNPYNDNLSFIPIHPYLPRTTSNSNTPPDYKLTIDLLVPFEAPQDEVDAYNTLFASLTNYTV